MADVIENSVPRKLKDEFLNEKQQVKYSYKDPKAKIIFAFREEYLPEFESVSNKIPSIKYSRFRLLPMNGNQAYTVITKTWKSKIDESEAHKIVGFLVNDEDADKNYDQLAIEPSLLSQVCTYIDKERVSQNKNLHLLIRLWKFYLIGGEASKLMVTFPFFVFLYSWYPP